MSVHSFCEYASVTRRITGSAEILGTRGKHLIDSHASNAFHLLVDTLVQHAPLALYIFAKDGMAVPIWIPYPRQVPRRENRNTWRPNCGSQMRGAIVIPNVESAPFEHLSRLHIGSFAGQVISSAVPNFTEPFSQRVVLRPSQYQEPHILQCCHP